MSIHKIRCCYVTVKTIKGTETYLVPSRSNEEAVAQFYRPDAEVTASGNFYLSPIDVTEGGTHFEFQHEGKYHYFEPGTPGYAFVAQEYNKVTREWVCHEQANYQ